MTKLQLSLNLIQAATSLHNDLQLTPVYEIPDEIYREIQHTLIQLRGAGEMLHTIALKEGGKMSG